MCRKGSALDRSLLCLQLLRLVTTNAFLGSWPCKSVTNGRLWSASVLLPTTRHTSINPDSNGRGLYRKTMLSYRSNRVVQNALLLTWSCTAAMVGALAQDRSASTLLHQAIDAQGSEQQLRAIRTVQWSAAGYRNELEESERPEGPYGTDFLTIREVDDYAGGRSLYSVDAAVYPVYKSQSTTVMAGGVAMKSGGGPFFAGVPLTVQLMRERLALNPERLLLTALDAPDAQREADTTLQSVPQNVIRFTLDGAPVRVFLNAYTHLPTAMDYSGPLAHTSYYAYLGDVTLRTYYSLW